MVCLVESRLQMLLSGSKIEFGGDYRHSWRKIGVNLIALWAFDDSRNDYFGVEDVSRAVYRGNATECLWNVTDAIIDIEEGRLTIKAA